MEKSLSVNGETYSSSKLFKDLSAGLVVFLVALPLCLGIALASNVPLFSGFLAGIIGGIVIGFLSGSQTSVSGPAAGLTAVVAAEIGVLGSFEAFLTAVVLAGVLQIILGIVRMGYIGAFFPSSVIKGLLAAIGIILILKQIPHLVGHDMDPMGNKSFFQLDDKTTITELIDSVYDVHAGAMFIGLISIGILVYWDKIKFLKKTQIPSALVVVVFGILINRILTGIGGGWQIEPSHMVQVPIANSAEEFISFLTFPSLNALSNFDVYFAAFTIGIIASLETLLNIEAIDKLDPMQRTSPPNRELIAQGTGNILCGLIGGLPVTSVIVRSSVNINANVQTKVSTIWHGFLLFGSVLFIPQWLNTIPLSCLAAILLVTGFKLASPKLFSQMWHQGRYQFLPFAATVTAIVFTDLLMGIVIGLCISIGFILNSHLRNPMKKIVEKHATGDKVLHIKLPNQVGFFNKASLEETLRSTPKGGHVLLDASVTDYIDPDIVDLIIDFKKTTAPAHNVQVSLKGFKQHKGLEDHIQFVDFSSKKSQAALTPERVLEILKEGHERFKSGNPLSRDLSRFLNATSTGQFPMAVILSCIDSRTPAEIIFDLGLGDAFSVRIAGNVISRKVIGSMEYACAVAGAKLILVMGHTSCGAVKTAVDLACNNRTASQATGCQHLDTLINEIKHSVNSKITDNFESFRPELKDSYYNEVAYLNVTRTIKLIRERSEILDRLVTEGKIAIVGAIYDVHTGQVSFFQANESSSIPLSLHNLEI